MPTLRVEQIKDDHMRIWVQVDCGDVLGGPHVAESLVFSGPTKDGERICNELNQLFSPKPSVPKCCGTCGRYDEPKRTCTHFSFVPPSVFHFCGEWTEDALKPAGNDEALAVEVLWWSSDFVVISAEVYAKLQSELHGLLAMDEGERGPSDCEHGNAKLECEVVCAQCGHRCADHVSLEISEETDQPIMPLCCAIGCRCGNGLKLSTGR